MIDKFIAGVRAALWGESYQWPSEETVVLMRLHAQQGTGSLVYPSVLADNSLPSYARAQMKGACMATIQQHTRLQHTLVQTWTALQKAGIDAVLMKGAGLAQLYLSPECRPWGDVDLFVGKDQYHPACAVMRETFPDALKFDEELDHYKHYNLIADGISIEVHRVSVGLQHPVDERRYAAIEQYGMSHAIPMTINGLEVRVPEPTFNALFVCLHSWEHMMTKGANLRQLCDHTLLMHHYASSIDRKRLKKYLRALHMMDVWQLFMAVEVQYLGLSPKEAPFYEASIASRAELLMKDLLSGRLQAPTHAPIAATNRFSRKWATMQSRIKDVQYIKRYSPAYSRHMIATTWIHGLARLFAKDRHWE